jgi:ACS family hexuronate transporter-like MFS transporter
VDRGLRRSEAWILTLVATLTMSISYADRQTLAVLAPVVTQDLDITELEYGWLSSAFSLAYLFGAPLAGGFVDRLGARRGLLWAVLLWSAVAASHALAPGFAVLFGLRIALGLAEAPSFPSAAQTVHRVLLPEDRARGFGVLFTGSSFGAMIAPPLATVCAARWGWRAAFLVTSAVGLIWVPAWLLTAFPARARAVLDSDPPDARGGPARSWPALLRDPTVVRALILVITAAPAIGFVWVWASKYLVKEAAVAPLDVGRWLWIPPLIFDLGSVIFGDLASRRGRLIRGEPERLLVGVSAALQATIALLPWAPGPLAITILAGLSMAGGGGMYAIATADMLAGVESSVVSRAGGVTAAAQSLALIIAHPLIGHGVETFGDYKLVTVLLGAWVIPGALIWIVWPRR